jgi:hypothetical protein
MTESQILTLNERVKGFCNFFFNLAAGLTAAVVARLWVNAGPDVTAAIWLAAVLILLSLASGLLYLLEPMEGSY